MTLFRLFDIEVRVHWSFILILVWGAFIYSSNAVSPVIGALYGILTILLLFLCVTLHEFGHALVAQSFGVKVPHITLLPIGGVASLERMPDKPIQSF
ncbi:MAG: site-2 protease family protein [Caldilineaceae bacterium]